MRRSLLLPFALPAIAVLAGCAPGALGSADASEPPAETVGASSTPSAPPSATTTEEPVALPAMPQTCADLDSPEAAAAAEETDYAPNAREWDAQRVEGLPAPLLTCLWGPAGGSDSLVTVGVYEVDDATIAVLAERETWTVSPLGELELHAIGISPEDHWPSDAAWAARDGRLVYVAGSQADATLALAAAVAPTVLGS